MSRTSRVRAIARDVLHRAWSHVGLLLVLGVAVVDRILFLHWWKAFPGGDTYNFILIAQELLRGSYPIAEKRLPVYPLLLVVAHAFLDWETAAVAVSLLSSLVSLVLFYALGRTLGISKVALVVALLPFQAIAPFLFQSIRGYADTTFVALVLGALLLFLNLRTRRGAVGLGVLLGAAALTRPEGSALVLAMLLLLLMSRARRRFLVPTTVMIVLLVGTFALLSIRAGRPLLPREYLLDAEATAFGVTTVRDFGANYGNLWQGVGSDRLWGEPLRLLRDATTTSVAMLPRRLWSFLSDPKEAPSLLLLLGLIFLLMRRRRVFLPVLIAFLALAAPIAWWGVRQRFLIPLYPLPYLLIAAGAHAVIHGLCRLSRQRPAGSVPPQSSGLKATERTRFPVPEDGESEGIPGSESRALGGTSGRLTGWAEPKAGRGNILASAAAVALIALAAGPWRTHTTAEAREVQAKNWGKDDAYYQAIQAARRLDGVIAFEHRSSIVLALFGEIDNHGRAVFADMHLNTPHSTEQWDTFQTRRIQYVVLRGTTSGALPVLSDPAFRDRFETAAKFTRPGKRGTADTAVILSVRRSK